MTSTNADKLIDPEKQILGSISLSSHLQTDVFRSKKVQSRSITMARIQYLSFGLLILVTIFITFSSASNHRPSHNELSAEDKAFQDLLSSVDPTSLHNVLHEHLADKYRDGVYQEDKAAMEVVHQSNAEVAHSLLELAKRQAGNATTSSTPPSTSDPATTTTTIISTSSVIIETTPSSTTVPPTTNTPSETLTQTPTPTPSQSTTAVQNTPSQSSSPAQTQSSTAVQRTTTTSTVSSTRQSTPQSSTNVAPTTKPGTSTTGKPSSTSVRSSITQQTIYTTTLPDGAVATVTSITVVPAPVADSTGSSKTGANGSLQTNSASPLGVGFSGVLGAACLLVIGVL